MQDHDLESNTENEFDSISIDEADPSFQYTIIPTALLRDSSISPNCRWLICYLLSNKPGWTIKSKQIWQHTKGFIGRDSVRKLLNEAIDAGYMTRTQIMKGQLRGFKYKVHGTPKLKKCLREPENQGPGLQEPDFQGPEIQGIKEVTSKELLSKENNSLKVQTQPAKAGAAEAAENDLNISKKSKREKVEFSEEVVDLTNKMISLLKAFKSNYNAPSNLNKFMLHVDYILRLDGRAFQLVLDVFSWALADSFWVDKMYKPNPAEYLRKQFDQLEMKMNAKPAPKERKFAPSSNDERSLKKMEEWSKSAL